MTENEFITLVRRWQDPGIWQTVSKLAMRADEFYSQAHKLGDDARLILDRGDVETASQLKSEADHFRSCAAIVLEQRAGIVEELTGLESWVRTTRPDLLEFVPTATFSGDSSEAIRDLKRLESRIKTSAATEQPAIPVVRTHSQWQQLLCWESSTWIRRRKKFPEAFTDVPGENACSIREPELTLWLASAENKKRSPFEMT